VFRMVIENAVMIKSRGVVWFTGSCENKNSWTLYLRDSTGRMIKAYPTFAKQLSYEGIDAKIDFSTHDFPDAQSIIGLELTSVPRNEWPTQSL